MAKRRLLWLLWCAAMGALYFFENNGATRILLLCSAVLPLAGALVAPVAARRVTVRLNVPKDAVKHADFRVICEIKRPLPPAGLSVGLLCRNLLTGETTEVVLPVRSAEPGCSLRTEHCGVLMLEATVTIQDAFGLLRPRTLRGAPASVWVAPQLSPLEIALDESGGDWSHDAASALVPGADASDPFSVREYIPGDPVRQIHWKLSRKTGMVMLRELRQPMANQVLLIFDASYPMDAERLFPETVDSMAEMFFSLSKTLLGMGIPHTVCWHPAKQPVPVRRLIASHEDWAELISAFFSDGPARNASILPDAFTESFAHVALVATGRPDTEAVCGFGRRLTVIAGAGSPVDNRMIL